MRSGTPLRLGDPRQLGPYALAARLGAGGQGVVYGGTRPDGKRVAVRVIHEDLAASATVRARLSRELAAAKRVAPFCVAQVLDADPDGTPAYIVSEYVDGPSLYQAVADRGPQSGEALQRLAIATSTALVAIHAAGVVHGDFKPGNVMLGPDGPRVIDFGIAPALESAMLARGTLGTPAYMAPEQIRGERVGPATDVFAWGCVIAYAASGGPPFGIGTVHAVHRILTGEPNLGALKPPLRELVASCLAKSPIDRPTALDLLQRLLPHWEGRPTWILTAGQSAAKPPATEHVPMPRSAPAADIATEQRVIEPAPGRRSTRRRRRRGSWRAVAGALAAVAAVAASALTVPRLLASDRPEPTITPTAAAPQPTAARPPPPAASPSGPYVGAWSGVGYQNNINFRWPVWMVVRPDGRGTIVYPGMRCSGDIRLRLKRYDIRSDPDDRCLDRVRFTLRQPAADKLILILYKWGAGNPIATVELNRDPPSGPIRVPAAFDGTWTGRNTDGEDLTVRLTGNDAGAAGRIEFGTGCGGLLTPTSVSGRRLTLAYVVDKDKSCHINEDVRLDLTGAATATLTHLDRFGRRLDQAQLSKDP
jgi:hypothetical protein